MTLEQLLVFCLVIHQCFSAFLTLASLAFPHGCLPRMNCSSLHLFFHSAGAASRWLQEAAK